MYLKISGNNIFDGYKFLGENKVLVLTKEKVVVDIIDIELAGENIKKVDGFLCPGFINAHCHLELSYLKNTIPKHTGMVDFLLQVIHKKNVPQEEIEQAIIDAEQEMLLNGIVAVGDICNTTNTIKQKQKQNLYYHNFIEIAGFVPNTALQRFNYGLDILKAFEEKFPSQNSIVPHAPYSVSKELFQLIHQFNKNKISSIHHQESEAENEFFKNKTGDFTTLYKALGIDISFFNPKYKSSSDYYYETNPLIEKNILVHNTVSKFTDIENFKNHTKQFFYCFCVLANDYINQISPDIEVFNAVFDKVIIGTDSLASNDSLNILNELQTIKNLYPKLSVENLLQFATINGAKALGIEQTFGSFEKNKRPGVLVIKDFDISKNPIII